MTKGLKEDFVTELRNLINRHGIDSVLNTPDYIIAHHLAGVLVTLTGTIAERDRHNAKVSEIMKEGFK